MTKMEQPRNCPRCGQGIPPDRQSCPRCDDTAKWWAFPRETVLLLTVPLLILLFTITGIAVRIYHAKEKVLAENWYTRGETALSEGKAQSAVEDFRSALAYSRDDPLHRLRLAQALIAANRPEQAKAHLLNIWERQPGDGTVNLELARLAANGGEVSDAIRYYHNAIFGVWPQNPELQRRQVRFELCEFLLSRGLKAAAQGALIELAADLPEDATIFARVGSLFLRAGDYPHALEQFQRALQLDSRNQDALRGAGEAQFQLADYRAARRSLQRALRLAPDDDRSQQLLEIANTVLSIDPLERRLTARERARRSVRAFEQAIKRLEACAIDRQEELSAPEPETALQNAYARATQIRPRVRQRNLQRDPDLLTNVTDLVFEIEELAAGQCSPPEGLDLALLLVAQKRGGTERE